MTEPAHLNQKHQRVLTITGFCTVLLCSFSLFSLAQPGLIAQETSRVPETLTGQLTTTSEKLEEDGSYFEAHTFTGTMGEAVTIELISNDFDAYLILLSPAGEPIAQNDDRATSDTHARITLALPISGTYTLFVTSYPTKATGTYQLVWRTATATEQTLAQASQLTQEAYELNQRGHYESAISLAEQALEIREAVLGLEHPDTATSLNNLAFLYVAPGRYAEAEPLFQQALAIDEAILGADHPSTATSLNNLAKLYELQGRYTEAETLFQRSLKINEAALGYEHPNTARSLNNLATLYITQGRYGEAEPLSQQALEIYKSVLGIEHPDTATSLNNLAFLYKSQGRHEEAEPLYWQALSIREEILGYNHLDTASSLNNLAALYIAQGRYGEAEPFLQQALIILESLVGSDHPDIGSTLNNLAELYESQGRYTEAEPLFQRALAISEHALGFEHPSTAISLNNLASMYQAQGRYGEAVLLFQRALSIFEAAFGSDHPNTAGNFSNLSGVYWAQGQLQNALTYLRRGLVAEETILIRNLVGGSDIVKQDYLATVAGTMNGAISLHLGYLPNDNVATQLAFTTILHRKGRILDFFTNLRAQLVSDPTALNLLDNLNASNTRLASLTYTLTANATANDYQTQLRDLQTQIQVLEDKLSRRSTDFAELTTSPSLTELQTRLSPDTVLVEFIRYHPLDPNAIAQDRFGDAHYAAYILQFDGTIQSIDLGPAKAIDTAVKNLTVDLANANTPHFQVIENAKALDALVMAPVRKFFNDTTIIFLSPDSTLNLVPFEALVDENGDYLIKNYQFRYLTSSRDLLRLDQKTHETMSTKPALLIGNPTYGRPGKVMERVDTRSIGLDNRIFPALPGTQTEVELIAQKLTGARVYTQINATEAVIKQQTQPSVLHIATHGFFESSDNAINPLLQSGLILAGAAANGQSGPDQDGILTALEITGLNLRGTQLVVLSACETGLGELAAGEGIYGLRRSLVLAGSQSQVISLWKVDDSATQELMVDYYDHLLSGTSRDAALRETQLNFLNSKEYNHPYYWAAFIGSGDWRPLALND